MEKKMKKSFVVMIKDMILKPISSVEENIVMLKDTKSTFVFAGIISVLITVCNLVSTMINAIFSKSYDINEYANLLVDKVKKDINEFIFNKKLRR